MAKKKSIEEKSTFWIFQKNDNNGIEKVLKAMLDYRVRHKQMPLECSEWIIQLCEENTYDKLIGYDLRQFILIKWNEFKVKYPSK